MSQAKGKTIWKYQLPVLERFVLKLPEGAQIIRIDDQGGMLWAWAIVNTEAPLTERSFRAFKTGAQMPDDVLLQYVGCAAIHVQMELMLYFFEELPRPLTPKERVRLVRSIQQAARG